MHNVLIVGGRGFVGHALTKRLAEDVSLNVTVLDNGLTDSDRGEVSGVRYLCGSSQDIGTFGGFACDTVFHLGEYSRVERSFEDRELVLKNNIDGTRCVIEYCVSKKAKLIYAGSSTRFADGGAGENMSPYAWSKYVNVQTIKNYGEWCDLNYAICYFYNVYGPNEICRGPYSTVVGIFRDHMKRGEALPVVRPGSQQRNFTHIDDTVDGMILVAKNGYGDDYGIGSDDAYSIESLAHLFGGEISWLAPRKGNRSGGTVKNSKVKDLGWTARNSLVDYVETLKCNSWQDGN